MPARRSPASGRSVARGATGEASPRGIDTSRHPAAAGRARPAGRGAGGSGRLLSADRAQRLATQHGVLADPVRLQLLHLVATHPAGEVRAGVLADRVGRSPSTVSHHLTVLLEAGLVRRRRSGRERLYRPTPAGQRAVAQAGGR